MASDRRLVRLADRGVEEIKGVGKKSAQSLREIGIETVLDLITFYPRRYIDRTNSLTIAELTEGTDAMVLANVARVQSTRTRNRRSLVQVDIADESGSLRCSFFNQAWRARQLVEGSEVIVAGKVTSFKGRPQMSNPTVDIVGKPGHRRTGRIVPIYPQSEKAGISTWDMELWIAEAIRRSGDFSDPLPAKWRRKLNLLDRTDAIRCIHFPADDGSRFAARRRIVIDEMLRLQLVLVERKRDLELSVAGIAHSTGAGESTAVVPGLLQELLRSLPFELTGGQTRAISEVCEDMAMAHPMHRLIQGDVGAGKTLVAVAALVASAQGGHQGAILVPTEVLAEQHATGIRALVEDLEMPDPARITGSRGFRVELLTSNTSATQRNTILRDLKSGLVDAVVGTHALLSEGVEFASLGVIIVDEQHRFGVEQRDALRSRRSDRRVPDLLVMTATPIPRTVAMTVFGDLDVTVIDELPPGRKPVKTAWLGSDESEAFEVVRQQVAEGHQAFVVCPLVGESEAIDARAATEEHFRLQNGPLSGLTVGLVHGQMAAREKEASMEAFRAGKVDVLVSTTVIEVGVDIPNATVMVIEDAWRFGIAQLHQLRGRVGRGDEHSWCFLLGETPQGDDTKASARLKAMCETTDGFQLAEKDLQIRGEGSVTGSLQSGRSSLKLGSVLHDRDLVIAARQIALDMIESGWTRDSDPDLGAEISQMVAEQEAGFLFKG